MRYWVTSTGTLHVTAECHSARRSSPRPVEVDLDPFELWETCWQNKDLARSGVLQGISVLPGDYGQYGISKWACLHCVEQAAIDLGWVNYHQPDPERRHR